MTERSILSTTLDWQGVTLLITYETDWLNLGERNPAYSHAHLEVQSLSPEREPLPITETGYRSHFLAVEEIEEAGGPVAFVQAWLDHEAQGRAWRAYREATRQLSLF